MTNARKQALKDMMACKVDVTVFKHERVLIELNNIRNETHIKIDFRCFNGGYHPKKRK